MFTFFHMYGRHCVFSSQTMICDSWHSSHSCHPLFNLKLPWLPIGKPLNHDMNHKRGWWVVSVGIWFWNLQQHKDKMLKNFNVHVKSLFITIIIHHLWSNLFLRFVSTWRKSALPVCYKALVGVVCKWHISNVRYDSETGPGRICKVIKS